MKKSDALHGDKTLADILGIFEAIFPTEKGAYASVPITSGTRLHRFLRERRLAGGTFDAKAIKEMQHRVIEPNVCDARAFARRLRSEYERPVIDPSRFVAPNGWTQDHFNALWAAIIKKYCNLVVFADGWEYSTGCTAEFVEACNAHIRMVDARGNALTRDDGIRLVIRAERQLSADGLETSGLCDRLKQLRLKKAIVPHPKMPQSLPATRRRLCFEAVGCVASGRSGILVARAHPKKRPWAGAANGHGSNPSATSRGARRLAGDSVSFLKGLRHKPSDIMIDIAHFVPADWPVSHLERFWANVIDNYVHSAAFVDNWYDSEICAAVFGLALRFDVRIVDARGATLHISTALSLLRGAIESLELAGIDASRHRIVLKTVERTSHVA
jgi:hypothetical protein